MQRIALGVMLMGFLESCLACSVSVNIYRPQSASFEDGWERVPNQVNLEVRKVVRGRGPKSLGDQAVEISCDWRGSVEVGLSAEEGLDACDFGYYFYSDEAAPSDLVKRYPVFPKKENDACVVRLGWNDGATWEQERLEFPISVEAVNNHLVKGNRSKAVVVNDDGRDDR